MATSSEIRPIESITSLFLAISSTGQKIFFFIYTSIRNRTENVRVEVPSFTIKLH